MKTIGNPSTVLQITTKLIEHEELTDINITQLIESDAVLAADILKTWAVGEDLALTQSKWAAIFHVLYQNTDDAENIIKKLYFEGEKFNIQFLQTFSKRQTSAAVNALDINDIVSRISTQINFKEIRESIIRELGICFNDSALKTSILNDPLLNSPPDLLIDPRLEQLNKNLSDLSMFISMNFLRQLKLMDLPSRNKKLKIINQAIDKCQALTDITWELALSELIHMKAQDQHIKILDMIYSNIREKCTPEQLERFKPYFDRYYSTEPLENFESYQIEENATYFIKALSMIDDKLVCSTQGTPASRNRCLLYQSVVNGISLKDDEPGDTDASIIDELLKKDRHFFKSVKNNPTSCDFIYGLIRAHTHRTDRNLYQFLSTVYENLNQNAMLDKKLLDKMDYCLELLAYKLDAPNKDSIPLQHLKKTVWAHLVKSNEKEAGYEKLTQYLDKLILNPNAQKHLVDFLGKRNNSYSRGPDTPISPNLGFN